MTQDITPGRAALSVLTKVNNGQKTQKGLVTYDRKIRKDAFYYYKSLWSDDAVLHIASRRDIARRDSLAEVKVYSNCGQVRLAVNGRDCGQPVRTENVWVWKRVPLKKGENRVEAAGERGGESLTDACKWVLF